MFVRIVHHWCKPGQVQAGREFMDNVGRSTAAAPGFVYRYRLEDRGDPNLLTTMTVWRDADAFAAFQAGRKPSDHADPSNPFERVSTQLFDVTGIAGDPGKAVLD